MYKKILAALILNISALNIAFAGANYNYTDNNKYYQNNYQPYVQQPLQPAQSANNTLKGNVVMVPAGTYMNAKLTAGLSSEYASVGQPIVLALDEDFYYENRLIAPAGSTIHGTVIEASKAKRGGANGRLCVRFNQIYTTYGTQIPISGVIQTEDNSGVLVGGTKMDVTKEYAKDLAVGSAAGALSGVVFGALAGGSIGRGAALGTAVGAGGGLVKSVWDKGKDVEIPANASINIVLTQPVTTTANPYLNEN